MAVAMIAVIMGMPMLVVVAIVFLDISTSDIVHPANRARTRLITAATLAMHRANIS